MVLLKPRANEHTLRTDDILDAIRVRACCGRWGLGVPSVSVHGGSRGFGVGAAELVDADACAPFDAAPFQTHGASTALVLLPGVQYYTGQLFDMAQITKAAHEQVRAERGGVGRCAPCSFA